MLVVVAGRISREKRIGRSILVVRQKARAAMARMVFVERKWCGYSFLIEVLEVKIVGSLLRRDAQKVLLRIFCGGAIIR
jgi:hypothetical protein